MGVVWIESSLLMREWDWSYGDLDGYYLLPSNTIETLVASGSAEGVYGTIVLSKSHAMCQNRE